MPSKFVSLFLVASACATPFSDKIVRQDCKPCNPQGASGSKPPQVGPDLDSLYFDVLQSVKDIHFQKRWSGSISPREDGFCCRAALDCVNVQHLNIPMCYDKFTTHFAFLDGSWGSLTTGEYDSGGGSANLLNGQYTKDGQTGDIYSEKPEARLNTATLSIPPQFTGTGVGSAIPGTEIASVITDAPAQTTAALTTTLVATGSQGAATTSPSSLGAASQIRVDSNLSLGMSVITAILYAIKTL